MRLYLHRTQDIVKVIRDSGEKCNIVVCMNASYSILRRIAKKGATVYFSTCTNYIKAKKEFDCHIVYDLHLKLYVTDSYIFFSTANASTSYLLEATLQMPKNPEMESFLSSLPSFFFGAVKHPFDSSLQVFKVNF